MYSSANAAAAAGEPRIRRSRAAAEPARKRSPEEAACSTSESHPEYAEDDAVRGGRCLGQEREPANAVVVPGDGGPLRRHAAARHAARAVAARDDIAVDAQAFARVRVRVRHRGPVRIDGVQFHVAFAEADVATRLVRVGADQIRHQQLLRIDEVTVSRQLAVPESVALTREPEFALAVRLRLFQQPVGQAAPLEGAYRPLLDEAGAGALFDELSALRFQ